MGGLTKENPIFPGFYADPDMMKYGDTYYVYPSTDGFDNWTATQFHVFSSKDLCQWKDEGVIVDVTTDEVPWAVGSAWAPAIHEKNGKFYFYFCGKREDGLSCIGVAVSDDPAKGFRPTKKPIVTMEMVQEQGLRVNQVIDPQTYEEDGEVYLLFGNGYPIIVKLTEDLLDICPETMRVIEGAKGFSEAISVFKRGGKYHFTWSSDDTRSENYHIEYGTSDRLFGPIEYQYPILVKDPDRDILGTGHHCICKEPNEDQYYIAYHRFSRPSEKYIGKNGFRRETCLDLIAFDSEGNIKPVVKH